MAAPACPCAIGRAGARRQPVCRPDARACRRAERTARGDPAYDKDVAALTALLDSGAADEETRAQAAARLDQLVADHQSELGLEETLNQAGYSPCVVLLQNGALTVIVASSDMTAEASAAILSLCAAHTDIGVENIRIMAREAL